MIKGTVLDFAIIVFYFLFILGFGTFFGKYVKSTKDFFFGGQRFSWWLIGFSCVATTVGSYSFIKYSAVAYQYGFSSTMTYLNDWFILPLFVFIWLPIIYYSRTTSIPEYFEKRFNSTTRTISVIILLVYLLGYIGINLYTIGVAFNAMFGWNVMVTAILISFACAVYMHAGGQTSVIMTDLAQALMLLAAGFLVFFLGIEKIGSLSAFWHSLPYEFKLPFSPFNKPPDFNFVGIFWQDAFGSSMAFYFINQGILMRFLSVRSPRDGRKAMFLVCLVLMPLAAFAVANAGWIGHSMQTLGLLPPNTDPNHIFVDVAFSITKPGIFGFIMAALIAALMSTIDTLINGVAAIGVNDIVKKLTPNKEDSFYLKWARLISLASAVIGVALVPLFMQFKSIYLAHGTFIAAVTPPMIVTILFGILWKRYTTKAAIYTLILGSIAMLISIKWPVVLTFLSHGVAPGGLQYLRALYGLIVCTAISIGVTVVSREKDLSNIIGLVVDTIHEGKVLFKGGEPDDFDEGKIIYCYIAETSDGVSLSTKMMEYLQAKPGDILYIADERWWLGGLRSIHAKAGIPHQGVDNVVFLGTDLINQGNLDINRKVAIIKII
ncbi:MAG: sodium:solute symporter family protein [Spirochaetota bacterium]